MRGLQLLALAAAASLLPATAALAQAAGGEEAAVNPKDKMVCKRTQRTGTRFYDQTCKTVGQWEAIAEESRRNLSEQTNRPQQNYQPTRPGE